MRHKVFDLVISGGGVCGYGHLGAMEILKKKEKDNKIQIRNIYATSAGVIMGLFYFSDLSYQEAVETYNELLEINKDSLHESVMKMLKRVLPKDIHKRCSKKLKINLTKINNYGIPRHYEIDEFISFEHLMLLVEASINIPYIIGEDFTILNEEKYCDGGIFANVPIKKNNPIPQLVMMTNQFNYPITQKFNLKGSFEQIRKIANDGLNKFNYLILNDHGNEIYFWHDNQYNNLNLILGFNTLFLILNKLI